MEIVLSKPATFHVILGSEYIGGIVLAPSPCGGGAFIGAKSMQILTKSESIVKHMKCA